MKGRKSEVRPLMLEYLKEHGRATRKELHNLRGETSTRNVDYHIRELRKDGLMIATIERGEDGYNHEWFCLADQTPGIPIDYLEYLIKECKTKDREKQERVQRELRSTLNTQGVDSVEALELILGVWRNAEAKGGENARFWRKNMWNLAKSLRERNPELLANMRERASVILAKLARDADSDSGDRDTALVLLHLMGGRNVGRIAWDMMLDPKDLGYDEIKTAVQLAERYAQRDYYNRRKNLYDLLDKKAGKDTLVKHRILDLLDRLEHH